MASNSNENGLNGKLKLHIDSNLIKSNTSILPDELKDLGVCAFDENDFEKGVLLQVDCQIAEYELNKAKDKLLAKKINDVDEESSSTSVSSKSIDSNEDSSINQEPNSANLKRKLNLQDKLCFVEKRAKLDSVLNDYNKYLNSSNDGEASSKFIFNYLINLNIFYYNKILKTLLWKQMNRLKI
jgi:hypothetical protein